jgi:hypothetical protein
MLLAQLVFTYPYIFKKARTLFKTRMAGPSLSSVCGRFSRMQSCFLFQEKLIPVCHPLMNSFVVSQNDITEPTLLPRFYSSCLSVVFNQYRQMHRTTFRAANGPNPYIPGSRAKDVRITADTVFAEKKCQSADVGDRLVTFQAHLCD